MYFSLLFWENKADFTNAVADIIGQEVLDRRLEFKMKLWVPHALKKLQTDWGAVDSAVDLMLQAWKKFPDSIGPLFTLEELALIRRNAHIRRGAEAVEYIKSGESLMRQPNFMALADALLAGVPKPLLGYPPAEMCAEALKDAMPDMVRDSPWAAGVRSARQASIDFVRELNHLLNQLLTKSA